MERAPLISGSGASRSSRPPLREHGFGNWSVWHYPSLDVNATYAAQHERDDLENPWLFMSTPTLCSPDANTLHAPDREQILEVITTCAYEPFRARLERDRKDYTRHKVALRDRILSLVEEHHVPELRDHLGIRFAGTAPAPRFLRLAAPSPAVLVSTPT